MKFHSQSFRSGIPLNLVKFRKWIRNVGFSGIWIGLINQNVIRKLCWLHILSREGPGSLLWLRTHLLTHTHNHAAKSDAFNLVDFPTKFSELGKQFWFESLRISFNAADISFVFRFLLLLLVYCRVRWIAVLFPLACTFYQLSYIQLNLMLRLFNSFTNLQNHTQSNWM